MIEAAEIWGQLAVGGATVFAVWLFSRRHHFKGDEHR